MAEQQIIPGEFLLDLFRLSLHDVNIQQIVVNKLQSNWLPEQAEKDFLTELKNQVSLEGRKPTFGTILLAARSNKNNALYEYTALVRDTSLKDVNTTTKGLEEFVKQAMFIEFYDSSANEYNRGNKKKAYSIAAKGIEKLNAFSLTTDLFEPIFTNFPKRQTARIIEANKGHNRFPTGIDELDDAIGGGPESKELMCILADSKGGKSFMLTHFGVNYARRGHAVAHFQLEGTGKQCNNRYDSCWSGSVYQDIKAGEFSEQKFKDYKKIIANLGRGEIFTYAPEKFGAMTVLDLRQMVIDLQKKRNIEVVIVDYMELLNPDNEHYGLKDERHRQQKVMRMLKELAMELNILVITATQASSISIELLEDPDFVIRREHLSEDKGKVRPVDFLISINRTSDERKLNLCRLFLEAAREYDANKTIMICQNLKRSRFYDRKRTLAEFYTE